ncbi:hypothetical protein DOY81_010099 [Sarcophaga bullata]|nr:hypothetical protein DOY81_010099 [Sarcophaga bullata]
MPRKKRSNSPFELLDDDFDDRSSQTDTKLSKLDTLRLATMYIKQLKSVVEGGGPHHHSATNGDILEGSTSNADSALTNCYLNLNSAAQSMNWPFGFHHQHHLQQLTTTSATRLNTANSSMAFINATNSNTSSNWCPNENNNNNEQSKYLRHQSEHQKQQQQQQYQNLSFMQHTTLDQQHNHHSYSETPSPELDSISSSCLTFENIQLVNQQEHHQQQQHHHHHHRHHHVLTHLQPASIHSSSTFHAAHNFLDHSQQRPQHQNEQQQQHHQTSSHHLSNGFGNSANFQATSIR